MPELVFAPSATVIAAPTLSPEGLTAWAQDVGALALLDDPETPLAQVMAGAGRGGDADALPEFAGRFCYRSFRKGRPAEEYIAHILESGHGSVLEHVNVSFALVGVSRALTHELIRHRAGTAISQESQRYVDASAQRFVVPPLLLATVDRLRATGDSAAADALLEEFRADCRHARARYCAWQNTFRAQARPGEDPTLTRKRANEAARALLPNAAETRLVWTMNLRAARHVVTLRGHRDADLEIRRLACLLARRLKDVASLVFADIEVVEDEDGFESVRTGHRKV
ncbi:FAD-dependent thymidylate synthase [Pararhodospirillum photometricum]|uniref:FAD-dependent thymidylate synthase n=1 Tax=Pararhodospirillum photometricum DSM 122 TaxID=1150469 RepID=H6SJT2_PARPM|nr:FAD-dependent thymidylate synthase [Pararhodospirillum photometricum]CCG08247.1 Thymidylate synthase (FAD) [Pararhodospirillum photometricum DSM 122]